MGYAATPRGGRTIGYRGSATAAYFDVPTTGTNVKGGWSELAAALPIAIDWLTVYLGGGGSAYYQADLGIGPAGAEVPIIQNMLFRTTNDFAASGRSCTFRYPLAAGTRVVARQANSNGTGRLLRMALVVGATVGRRLGGCQRVTSYGQSAFSAGTDVDPGGTVGAKGAWVQLAAALTYPVRAIMLTVVQQAGHPFTSYRFDVGIGAAGAEVVVAGDLPTHVADLGQGSPAAVLTAEVNLPAGARLAVRCAADVNAANRVANLTALCQG